MVKRTGRGIFHRYAVLCLCGSLAAVPFSAQAETTGAGASASPGDSPSFTFALPAEAPSSLFAVDLGGSEAELLVRGSWEAKLNAALGVNLPPGGAPTLSTAQPLLFTQTPDLFLSFLLFKKLFVEARVADNVEEAKYSMGYRGGEDQLLQEVRVGNDKISFPSLPFLSLGEGSYRSFGIAASAAAGDFQGRAMIRYDQANRVVKRFIGSSEITDTVISATAFMKSRWFATPTFPATNLSIYVANSGGSSTDSDGGKWRKLQSGEYSYAAVSGFIALKAAAVTKVAAAYSELGATAFMIDGSPAFLLHDPDRAYAPDRQVLCRYSTAADPASGEAFVRDTASALRDDSFQGRIDGEGFVEITKSVYDPRDASGLYARPFMIEMPWLYSTDFSESGPRDYAPVLSREIVVRSRRLAEYIAVDKDLVPGSVEVRRNGANDYSFSVDLDTGRLVLSSPPGLAEEIEVSYLRETAERRAGSLAGALGGIWKFGAGREAWTAIGLRWSLPGSSFSTAGENAPGTLTLTAGERDTEGGFRHRASIAGTYSQEEASGRYRIEGMESAPPYGSSFRPTTSTPDFSAREIAESSLASRYPQLIDDLHKDGTPQKALRITAGVSGNASLEKIVDVPPWFKLKSFSFFAKGGDVSSAALSLAIDDGSGAFISIALPPGALTSNWRRFMVQYGQGDSRILMQDGASAEKSPVGTDASVDVSRSTAARIAITVAGAAESEEIWVDEILLEDAVGKTYLQFQGDMSYADNTFLIGSKKLPLVGGLEIKSDATAAFHENYFAAGGLSLRTNVGPLGLGIQARASGGSAAQSAFRGGHEMRLPSFDFPLRATDVYDFDPSTGAFGREDKLAINASSFAVLDLRQKTSWIPSATSSTASAGSGERGVFAQEWEGKLGLIGQSAVLGMTASNRARPLSVSTASDYGYSWIDAFGYALPAFESDAERREIKATFNLRVPGGGDAGKDGKKLNTASIGVGKDPEIAGISASTVGEPGGGLIAGSSISSFRRDEIAARLALPLRIGALEIAPYYKRTWKDRRVGVGKGMLDDASIALSDLQSLSALLEGIPLAELFDDSLGERFAAQSSYLSGSTLMPLPEASLVPEIGLLLSREYGSFWRDLVIPSSLAFAFKRELTRTSDSLTDAAVWDANAKFASINLFGASGAYPTGLPFSDDEYLASIQATLRMLDGESAPRLKFQSQHFTTLYAGLADSLSIENRLSIASDPGTRTWTEALHAAYSTRVQRHWLLDLYRILVPAMPAASFVQPSPEDGAGGTAKGAKKGSIVSLYLEDISRRNPVLRSTFDFKIDVSGSATDKTSPAPTWGFEESYEAKLTVPERLTILVKGGVTQKRDGSTGLVALGLELSLGMTVSF